MSARDKATILLAVAGARRLRRLVPGELERLRDLGGEARLEGIRHILALSRGEEVATWFAEVCGLDPAPDGSAEPPAPAEVAEALRSFTSPERTVPFQIQLLADATPSALVGYRELRAAVAAADSLESQLVELTLFAIACADYVTSHAAIHAARARADGATVPQLTEAGLCAVPSAGMAAWLIAAEAIATKP